VYLKVRTLLVFIIETMLCVRYEVKERAFVFEINFTFTKTDKQLENVEYFNYLCSLLTSNVR